MNEKTFCEMLKDRRLELRMSLRAFCRVAGEDPANFSRIERGLKAPPNDDVLMRYGKALQLCDNELRRFLNLGALFRRELPKGLTDEELAGKLPALLRIIDGTAPTGDELEAAVAISKKAFRP